MTNDYIAVEIANEVEKAMLSEGANSAYAKSCALLAQKAAMDMAYRKDAQPPIIEIFGKRVKIVVDVDGRGCRHCSLSSACRAIRGSFKDSMMCKSAEGYVNRHFVEVDENGKELNK